jgi:hypothetical protein
MKKFYFFFIAALFLFSCSKSKEDPIPSTAKVTYITDIKPIIATKCTPCHLPPDGFKTFFNTYEASKLYIDEMIRRIQLPRTDTLSMPWKLGALPSSQIQKFIQWKADGLLEK